MWVSQLISSTIFSTVWFFHTYRPLSSLPELSQGILPTEHILLMLDNGFPDGESISILSLSSYHPNSQSPRKNSVLVGASGMNSQSRELQAYAISSFYIKSNQKNGPNLHQFAIFSDPCHWLFQIIFRRSP